MFVPCKELLRYPAPFASSPPRPHRDAKAIHLELDELIRTSRARDVFADLEDADEQELERFHQEFVELRRRRMMGVEDDDAADTMVRGVAE